MQENVRSKARAGAHPGQSQEAGQLAQSDGHRIGQKYERQHGQVVLFYPVEDLLSYLQPGAASSRGPSDDE
jgi:hypothetical protein